YVNPSDLVKKIGKANNKNVVLLKGFAKIIYQLTKTMKIFQKVFGNLVYKSDYYLKASDYEVYDFEETIKISEGRV
ncbi:MAG: NAD-dependent epimerase, partial [Tetragenococcus koreensis]|nr:NAD-dependent epimerase [Tetragenococcus koreensis]